MFLIILFINLIVNGQHAFYSKNNLDYDQTLLSFQRIEQVTGENLENFIKKIERVDLNNIPAGYRPSGFIIVKLIIDEQGELEVAMIAQSLCPLLDSLVIDAIKKYDFVQLINKENIPYNYSFQIKYTFLLGTSFFPKLDEESKTNSRFVAYKRNQKLKLQKYLTTGDGAINLSSYNWNWQPYIDKLKNKVYKKWIAPEEYSTLGLISGYTIVKFEIDRNGNLVQLQILEHSGDPKLQNSSINAIKSLFPFIPLPEDFPDSTLTITAKLIYPDLRSHNINF